MGSRPGVWLAAALCAAALLGVRRWSAIPHARAVGILVVIPILVPFALSYGPVSIFGARYTIPAALALSIGLALVTLRHIGGRLGILAAAAVTASLVAGVVAYHREPPKQRWDEAVPIVEAGALPGEIVVVDPGYYRVPYRYYAGRVDVDVRTPDEEPAALGRRFWIVTVGESLEVAERLHRPGYVTVETRRLDGRLGTIHVALLERAS
jgi:hypothetical protein